jgi:hypothetical protein
MSNSSDWTLSAEKEPSNDDLVSKPARRRLNSHDEYIKHGISSSLHQKQRHDTLNSNSDNDGSPKRRQFSLGSYTRPVSPRHNSSKGSISSTSQGLLRNQNSAISTSTANNNNSMASKESNKRVYRGSDNRFVTRDIAALDFLLGIPLAAEPQLVTDGWALQQRKEQEEQQQHYGNDTKTIAHAAHGTWWEKYIRGTESNEASAAVKQNNNNSHNMINDQDDDDELERPNHVEFTQQEQEHGKAAKSANKATAGTVMQPAYTPGRRLDGDIAVRVQIPVKNNLLIQTKQKAVARQATIREWERATAHGLCHAPMLDGRLFFSADSSYPVSVFSVIRYEPRREHAAFMRKKLESLGGGGSQFVMPTRDWRGISYRALLPMRRSRHTMLNQKYRDKAFNRFLSQHSVRDWKENGSHSGYDTNNDDEKSLGDDDSLSEDDDSVEPYVPGVLDDPEMVLGRHRNVMIGDHVIGPMVTSTIQFVKPELLKAELNKQFREQFDGWEPPKAARKFIGAYVNVQEGKYLLKDPAEAETSVVVDMTVGSNHTSEDISSDAKPNRRRQSSVTSAESVGESTTGLKEIPTLRIPPSLTLSKIRSVKEQALKAAVMSNLEIGTVALACVYFERLCLDCRVDKSNRRLTFAACLLLAAKLNEPNVGLVITTASDDNDKNEKTDFSSKLVSLVKPNKRSNNMFASLLEFFTQEWSLSIKNLLDAEWGVFAALRFSLHATPLQVAFHFRRLLKSLALSPREYLGEVMWEQWQEALEIEEQRNRERERRLGVKRKRKEERLRDLQMELENEVMRMQKNVEGEVLRRSQGTSSDNKSFRKDEDPRDNNLRGPTDRFKSFGKRTLSSSQLDSDGTYSSRPSNRSGDAIKSAIGKSFVNLLNPPDHRDDRGQSASAAGASNTTSGTPRNRGQPSRGTKPPLRTASSGKQPFSHLRSSSDVQDHTGRVDSEDERRRGRKPPERTSSGRNFFNRLGVRRIVSVDRMAEKFGGIDLEQGNLPSAQGNANPTLRQSPSMPILHQSDVPDFVAISIPDNTDVSSDIRLDDNGGFDGDEFLV